LGSLLERLFAAFRGPKKEEAPPHGEPGETAAAEEEEHGQAYMREQRASHEEPAEEEDAYAYMYESHAPYEEPEEPAEERARAYEYWDQPPRQEAEQPAADEEPDPTRFTRTPWHQAKMEAEARS
jgi:hypothetical protein